MTERDKDRFRSIMAALALVFPNMELDQPTIEIYYRALSDLDIQSVSAAVEVCIKECTFFPRPAEIRQRCFLDFDHAKQREDAKAYPKFSRPSLEGQAKVKALVGAVLGEVEAISTTPESHTPPEAVADHTPTPPKPWVMSEANWRARWDMGKYHADLLPLRAAIPEHFRTKFAQEDAQHSPH